MNKKGLIKEIVGVVLALILLIIALLFFSHQINKYEEYNKYKDYCSENDNVCYCSWGNCKFKVNNGVVMDKENLCKIAFEIKDKEAIFSWGCK